MSARNTHDGKARRRKERAAEPRFIVTCPGGVIPPKPYPPGAHPGSDLISVVWPGSGGAPGDVRTADVTRDEFTRRLAGLEVVTQVNADPLVRVVVLAQEDAIARWVETEP